MGSAANRLDALKNRHRELDREIAAAEARPFRDEAAITAMKKSKLELRDEIAQMEAREEETA